MTCPAVPRSTIDSCNTRKSANRASCEKASTSNQLLRVSCRLACAVVFTAAQAIAPQAASAQRGGGGGGHAGGGGHFGGGAGHVSSAPHASSSSHAGSSKPVVGSASSRPASGGGTAVGRSPGVVSGAAGATSIHTDLTSGIAHVLTPPGGPAFAAPRNVTIGFPPRADGESARVGTPRAPGNQVSFYGDGNTVWAEPSSGAQVVHRSGAPPGATHGPNPRTALAPPATAIHTRTETGAAGHTSATGSIAPPVSDAAATKTAAPHASLFATSNPLFGTPIESHRRPRRPRFGFPPIFPGFGNFGFFGESFFGFGWGGNGWTNCDPTWSFGCDGFGDRTSGYESGTSANSDSVDTSQGIEPPDDEVRNTWIDPPGATTSAPDDLAAEKSLVVLFLADGSVYAVTNYWVAGGKLHYATSYGGDNSLDLNQLDLQRTVNANSARGVDFTLRPAPEAAPKPTEDPPGAGSVPQQPSQPPQQPD